MPTVSLFDRITEFHGRLSDLKIVWWPFLFLKPDAKATPISWGRLVVMTFCFGMWFAMILSLKILIFSADEDVSGLRFIRALGTGLLTFCVWFNVVTRPLWNRRARKLAP